MANINEMTRDGYDKLNAELEELITVTRKENAERLKEAISYGDISENAEYDAAKDAQAETEERINEIEAILRTAVVIDEDADEDSAEDYTTVQTGRTVTVKDLVYNETVEYKIVGNTEADPFNGKLSNASLVGQALMGNKAGDVVEFPVPEGIAKYEILEVRK
ncbi:MAG: transcription elongation factor GreA [Clostridiales bacterium]|nr:transcription elongation factor GreA [Candidatus Crickella merdequi]